MRTRLLAVLTVLLLALGLVACDDDSGANLEEGTQELEEGAGEAGEELEEGAGAVGEELEEED